MSGAKLTTSVSKSVESNRTILEEQKAKHIAEDFETERIVNHLHASLAQYVKREIIINWLQKSSVNKVRNAIDYTLKQIRQGTVIKNVAGYIQKVINTPLPSSHDVANTPIDQVRQQAKEQAQAAKQQLAIQEARLQVLTETKHKIALQVVVDHPEWHDSIQQHMKSGLFGKFYNNTLSLVDNIQNPVMYGPFFQIIERLQPLVFNDLK